MNLLVSLICALQHSTCVQLSLGKSYKRKLKYWGNLGGLHDVLSTGLSFSVT